MKATSIWKLNNSLISKTGNNMKIYSMQKTHFILILVFAIFLNACTTKKQVSNNNDSPTIEKTHRVIPGFSAPSMESTERSEPAVCLGEISSLMSLVLNKTIPLSIHLPANYDSSRKTYPVLYMLGSDYRARVAMLASTLDYMGEGQIPEMILV
jgi:hypothetical protein